MEDLICLKSVVLYVSLVPTYFCITLQKKHSICEIGTSTATLRVVLFSVLCKIEQLCQYACNFSKVSTIIKVESLLPFCAWLFQECKNRNYRKVASRSMSRLVAHPRVQNWIVVRCTARNFMVSYITLYEKSHQRRKFWIESIG